MDIFNGLTLKQISLMTPEDHRSVTCDVFYKDVKAWSDKYFTENRDYINSQQELISCLYDVNLLPEQILSYLSVKEDMADVIKARNQIKQLKFIVDLWRNLKEDWQPISRAKKDGTVIWAKFKDDVFPNVRPNRPDLENWNGVQVPLRHSGVYEQNGTIYDHGWNVAAPVGSGGFPDDWIAGWISMPESKDK